MSPWIRNQPLHLLEAEVAPHTDRAIWHVLVAPSLALRSFTAEPSGDDVWQVRLVVQNPGWLPTNVTANAMERKAVKPLVAELAASDAVEPVGTNCRVELGHFGGGRGLPTGPAWSGRRLCWGSSRG